MNKLVTFLSMLFIMPIAARDNVADTVLVSEHVVKPHDEATLTILLRYYHVARLYKPLTKLRKYTQTSPLNFDELGEFIYFFNHPKIQSCMRMILDKKSLNPLWEEWRLIKTYTEITDEEYVREFALIVAIIFETITLNQTSSHLHRTLKTLSSLSIEDLLSHVSQFIFKVQRNKFTNKYVSVSSIAARLYLLNRLAKPLVILNRIHKKRIQPFSHNLNPTETFSIHNVFAHHLEKSIHTNNLKDLIEISEQMQAFEYLDTFESIKDFLKVILIIGRILQSDGESLISYAELITVIHGQLESSTIESLLGKIDSIYHTLEYSSSEDNPDSSYLWSFCLGTISLATLYAIFFI